MDCRIVALVTNLPGPLAAARLVRLGAEVVKFEPIDGDPLATMSREWYEELIKGMTVFRGDLHVASERRRLDNVLAASNLLLTSIRPNALNRLGLLWDDLHARYSQLCHVAIIGEAPPNENRAGHDLTYQARAGLLAPPMMPPTLFADLFAAERALSGAAVALYEQQRSGIASRYDVAIAEAADSLADPLRYGLCGRGAPLGGLWPNYHMYRARDGWIAIAALEPHFKDRLRAALRIKSLNASALRQKFSEQSCEFWEHFAQREDLPIARVRTLHITAYTS
jgi:alpha-methylacyl-CoA racemase